MEGSRTDEAQGASRFSCAVTSVRSYFRFLSTFVSVQIKIPKEENDA